MTTNKKWRVRTFALIYFACLFTFVGPTAQTQPPIVEPIIVEPVTPKEYARDLAKTLYGWNQAQFKCLAVLWGKESAWNPTAVSPTNDHGIPQRNMPNATSAEKKAFLEDTEAQIEWGLGYIKHRYETPCNAWSFWQKNNWY